MKQNLTAKFLLAGALLALGVVARADMAVDLPDVDARAAGHLGLLGQTYGTLTYSYVDLAHTSTHADNYRFEMNQPLAFGLDGVFAYDYAQTGAIGGSRLRQHELSTALRAFSNSFNWGKPYVEAGVGYAWNRFAGASDNSFLWGVAAGTEFQVASSATLTPYVQYADTPDLTSEGIWNFGVRGSYWVDTQWAVTAGLERNDEQSTAFTVGTNFRF